MVFSQSHTFLSLKFFAQNSATWVTISQMGPIQFQLMLFSTQSNCNVEPLGVAKCRQIFDKANDKNVHHHGLLLLLQQVDNFSMKRTLNESRGKRRAFQARCYFIKMRDRLPFHQDRSAIIRALEPILLVSKIENPLLGLLSQQSHVFFHPCNG